MNTFMDNLQNISNYDLTENGALTYFSTKNMVFDMFSLGGAYRNRSDEDCILLFKNAFEENAELALKCLFYLRDCRGGQGERRFFRVCFKWLAQTYPEAAARDLKQLPVYGRWDDILYTCIGTPIEASALEFIKEQLALDLECKTPSLCAKWIPSENTSSRESKRMAAIVRTYLQMSHKEYRKMLSTLRERIRVVERLMSANRWTEIEFDRVPSKAGLIYRNAFARRDIIAKKYETFAKDKNTKVNADVLYPQEIARKAFKMRDCAEYDDPNRLMLQKYWDNLPNFYGDNEENGIAVVDVSGSMIGVPMEAAVSMGAYIAEKAHGPFAGHFITFSGHPELVKFEGVDIKDKFKRCVRADWGCNTDIEAVFDLLLSVAKKENIKVEDMPQRIYIFSDMEFDEGLSELYYNHNTHSFDHQYKTTDDINTLMESIAKEWEAEGYKLPSIVFWNLDARHNNIPAIGEGFSYVSGFSPVMIETILSGKDGIDLMYEKLNSERYKSIL